MSYFNDPIEFRQPVSFTGNAAAEQAIVRYASKAFILANITAGLLTFVNGTGTTKAREREPPGLFACALRVSSRGRRRTRRCRRGSPRARRTRPGSTRRRCTRRAPPSG